MICLHLAVRRHQHIRLFAAALMKDAYIFGAVHDAAAVVATRTGAAQRTLCLHIDGESVSRRALWVGKAVRLPLLLQRGRVEKLLRPGVVDARLLRTIAVPRRRTGVRLAVAMPRRRTRALLLLRLLLRVSVTGAGGSGAALSALMPPWLVVLPHLRMSSGKVDETLLDVACVAMAVPATLPPLLLLLLLPYSVAIGRLADNGLAAIAPVGRMAVVRLP